MWKERKEDPTFKRQAFKYTITIQCSLGLLYQYGINGPQFDRDQKTHYNSPVSSHPFHAANNSVFFQQTVLKFYGLPFMYIVTTCLFFAVCLEQFEFIHTLIVGKKPYLTIICGTCTCIKNQHTIYNPRFVNKLTGSSHMGFKISGCIVF